MGETRDHHPAPILQTSLAVASRWWLLLAAILLLVASLRAAAVVFLPIVLGLVMAMALAPIVDRLASIMWRWLACLITMLVPTLVLVLVGGFIWFAGQQLVAHAGAFSPQRAMEQLSDTRSWLADRGVPEGWMRRSGEQPEDSESNDDAVIEDAAADAHAAGDSEVPSPRLPQGALERAVNLITGGLGSLFNGGVAIGFAFVFCYFALSEAPRWRKWVESWSRPQRSEYTLSVASQWSVQLRRYLIAKTMGGLITGITTWLWLWMFDVPLAFVWGGLTFLMNFIPSIGPLLSSIPPIVLALIELGLAEALIVAGGMLVIETVAGNVLEPLLQGGFLKLSPFAVLASLVFWSWMWGVVGAVLAPILTAAAITAVSQLRVRSEKPPDG